MSKKIFKTILSSLLILSLVVCSNISVVNAFTNSCSGEWSYLCRDVYYNYNSDGTLVFKGTNGTEDLIGNINTNSNGPVVDAPDDFKKNWKTDISTVIFNNLDTVGYYATGNNAITSTSWVLGLTSGDSCNITTIICDANKMGSFARNLNSLEYFSFGSNAEAIGKGAFGEAAITTGAKIVIPSNVTTIDENCMYITSDTNITVVCDYGSAAYNWAVDRAAAYPDATINIELTDITASSAVELDNTQKYEVIVPETTEFAYSNEGWKGDTFLGIVGTVPNGVELKVKTDSSFIILGDEIISAESVTVSTEDENSVKSGATWVTTLDKDTIDTATDTIEYNNETKQGYKIDYKCVVNSGKLMKQTYNGTINFLITE